MTYLGLDIGANTVRLAVAEGGNVRRLAVRDLPAGLPLESGRPALTEELAAALRHILREEGISVRRCALALPTGSAFVRRVTLPQMTVKQLETNLPYEFRDYIQQDKNDYSYDYAVMGTSEGPEGDEQLDLLIAAASKETIAAWRRLLARAGLRLTVAIPEYLTYRNLISAYEAAHPGPREYCLADLGRDMIRVHMYRGRAYETTRVIEYDGALLRTPEKERSPQAQEELFNQLSVEILRAVNFYAFNNPGSHLEDIYFGGELASLPALIEALGETLPLRLHSIGELLPAGSGTLAERCPAAIGAALEGKGR